jgi:hypothetical protein
MIIRLVITILHLLIMTLHILGQIIPQIALVVWFPSRRVGCALFEGIGWLGDGEAWSLLEGGVLSCFWAYVRFCMWVVGLLIGEIG